MEKFGRLVMVTGLGGVQFGLLSLKSGKKNADKRDVNVLGPPSLLPTIRRQKKNTKARAYART